MKKADSKQKIFDEALKLIMANGYENVSVNQIVEAAGVHKTTFYRAYPSKEELGREYLDILETLFLDNFAAMKEASPAFKDFLERWAGYWMELYDAQSFLGCPVANFSAHINSLGSQDFGPRVTTILKNYTERLESYIQDYQSRGDLSATIDSQALAGRLFVLYEGAVLLCKMTGERKYLEEGGRMMQSALREAAG